MTNAHQKHNAGSSPLDTLPRLATGKGFDLLEGIRILDLTTSVAGPFATMLLADMGAEVMKLERPGLGDDARAWGPPFLNGESLWFLSVNRNKKSLSFDHSSPEGRAVLHDLVRQSDVVVVNQPPRVASKLGLDAASLQQIRPDLVYVSITGFGLAGERADWTCYDLIAEGYSGVMDLTGEAGGEAQKIGTPAADMLAGQDAAFATVSALLARARTGKGRVIDIALVDSMTRFLTCRIVPYLGSGEVPRRSGGKDSVIAIYQTFETADEPITLGLGNDAIWRRFWQAVGEPAVAEDPAYASNADRRVHRSEIVARIQAALIAHPRSYWLAVLRAARIPSGPINRIDEVAADPEMRRRGMIYAIEAEGGLVPQVGTGIRLDGSGNVPRSAPPALGEHTREILDGLLGYNDDRIRALAAAGVL
ncbi:CoA transferase [Bosea sp. (in: a-proteobacteria)]|uniref:CaiB/BaiF CoA transferase family protein n=1 Tax=Bosea sp. (in: a-proteobacteria) TaxID=1871050 RepID=UPI0025C02843|nr:CoA transferase [Bosea sp. (in: a-proteobacteria)]